MNVALPLHSLKLVESIMDANPDETAEWRDAFLALVATEGPERARFMLDEMARMARAQRIGWQPDLNTPYVNTVSVESQPVFPGDLAMEEKLASIMRWNALAMVVRANKAYGELGGHIASYASAADLFEIGFNHFFHARDEQNQHRGDLVFFQPHSAPGVYARAYLEGRLSEADLEHYRQEIVAPGEDAQGLSSYPHPWLMPDFWQFPTGSMGIGPISSIYHARFMRYLTHRNLLDCKGRKVWGVFGDGEMDEPESMSALTLAAREGLDNLVWVVNCNLQRLDGPVRGNGRVIDELERHAPVVLAAAKQSLEVARRDLGDHRVIEFETRVAALEIEAVRQLAIGLVDRVGEFVLVDFGNNVEGGHGGGFPMVLPDSSPARPEPAADWQANAAGHHRPHSTRIHAPGSDDPRRGQSAGHDPET